MFEIIVDNAGAIHQLEYFSRINWNAFISIKTPIAYAIPLAIPILIDTEIVFSFKYNRVIDDKIANGKEYPIIFWASDLPINLVVKSVVTITSGKLNAAQVILNP